MRAGEGAGARNAFTGKPLTRHLLVDLVSSTPHMRLPEWARERLIAAAPDGWRVTVIDEAVRSSRTDSDKPGEVLIAALRDAEAHFGYGVPDAFLENAASLQWVHSASAGVSVTPMLRSRGITFTNSAGIYSEGMADTVLAGVLHFVRGLDIAVRQQAAQKWDQHPFSQGAWPTRELNEYRVLVIGAGGIGSAVAQRFTALGCEGTGVRRRPELGVPPGFACVVGPDALDAALASADVVVLAAPETPATRQVLDGQRLALLPAGAIVVNVARGGLLADEALLGALDAGHLRGAVLDVFGTEPLPADSPYWGHSRVLVTPHVSGVSAHRKWERLLDLFEDNWRRWAAGEPLRNVVDLDAGY